MSLESIHRVHRVMLVVQSPLLERALGRLLSSLIRDVNVEHSFVDRTTDGASLGESARRQERLRRVHDLLTDRDYDVIVVDLSDPALGRTVVEKASRRAIRPFVIALVQDPHSSDPSEPPGVFRLVKFSSNKSMDLATNIVSKVKEALRRVYQPVERLEQFMLDPTDLRWIDALRTLPAEEVGAPSALERTLRGALPRDARTVADEQGRPRCLAFSIEPELPWEWLLPPDGVKPDGRPFVAARVYPRRGPSDPGRRKSKPPATVEDELPESTRAPLSSRPFSAVHVVFPPVEDEWRDEDVPEPDTDQSGIRGEYGLKALSRFAQHVGGACRPVLQQTLDDIAAACATGVDILHVACHARVVDGRGEVRLSQHAAFGDAHWIPGEMLAQRLALCPPRVVVLEACTSGLGPGGVAAHLIRAGVEAVVCFQVRPPQQLAAKLVETFYEGLRETCALDHALWATRHAGAEGLGWAAMVIAVADKSGLDVLSMFRRSGSLWPLPDGYHEGGI